MEAIQMNKHTSTLEDRIRTALANPLGSDALTELIREVETAAAAADATAVSARTDMNDLVASPDPKAARDRLVEAETRRDRLAAARKPLGDSLSAALAAEQKDRWWANYKKVKAQLDEAVLLFHDYREHAEAIVQMFSLAAEVDRTISHLNETAPDGIDRRLRPVELTARCMTAFSRDNPSLAANTVLPRWDASARTLWPAKPATSLAAEVAGSMLAPPHPYPGGWGDPIERERRREAVEREQARSAAFHESAARDEEDRKNSEEREKLTAHTRR
jgi:hypothetical protein